MRVTAQLHGLSVMAWQQHVLIMFLATLFCFCKDFWHIFLSELCIYGILTTIGNICCIPHNKRTRSVHETERYSIQPSVLNCGMITLHTSRFCFCHASSLIINQLNTSLKRYIYVQHSDAKCISLTQVTIRRLTTTTNFTERRQTFDTIIVCSLNGGVLFGNERCLTT